MAQPAEPAQKLHGGDLQGRLGALEDAETPGQRKAAAEIRSTNPAVPRMKTYVQQAPMMIVVPNARFPEEPGAVIPHAGICEGGVGQPTSLP